MATFSISNIVGFIAYLGPLFLYLVMRFMTVPISERSTRQRCGKAYETYQNDTSMIALSFKVLRT